MFLFLKGIFHSLFLPPLGFLVLAIVAYGFLFSRFRKQATIVLGAALALQWLLSMPVVGEGLWRLAEGYPALDLTKPTQAQAIVVIGGDSFRPLAPEYAYAPVAERELLERLTYTAYLARRTQLPVAVSGNGPEAEAMSTTLARHFDIKTRWVESHSRDTFENARETAKLLRPDGVTHIILVTSATHLWRAAHEFRDAGFKVDPGPAVLYSVHPSDGVLAVLPSTKAAERSYEAIYELVGEPVRVGLSALHLRRHTP
jgi:uncharacterized SAM-binding protein YcdF (DUF218 family)